MLTTLAALAVFLTKHELEDLGELIFPNSAFFVAFMIQAAFLGNGMELLLPRDLVKRGYSPNTDLPHFHYGLNNAFFLTYFSIGLFYSGLVILVNHFTQKMFSYFIFFFFFSACACNGPRDVNVYDHSAHH